MRPPPENFFFLDSGDLVSVCSMVLSTPDSVPPGPLYYHSPCVNTQATYSKAKPITIIVNADVIQCVLIVRVCMPPAAGVGKTDPGPVLAHNGATLTTQYSQPLPAPGRPVCGYCTAGGLDAMGRSTRGPFPGVWLLHTVYQINSAFCLHLPQVCRR